MALFTIVCFVATDYRGPCNWTPKTESLSVAQTPGRGGEALDSLTSCHTVYSAGRGGEALDSLTSCHTIYSGFVPELVHRCYLEQS